MSSYVSIAALIASIVALALAGYLLWEIRSLVNLKNTFFAGGKAVNLEELLHSIAIHIQEMEKKENALDKRIENLEHTINFAIQKIGVLRFNPFGDGGGNFSFCIALLDAHNSGLVLTSMHGREQNRIYSKRILNGKSEFQLTEEEIKAIDLANESKTK
jgi:hypothetical protein